MTTEAFHLAVLAGDLSRVSEYLAQGIDVNVRSNTVTALHLAAEEANYEMVELLLRHGASADAEDGNGNTPLSRAVYTYTPERGARRSRPSWLLAPTQTIATISG